jgi:acyl-CoA thioester hydrolase
MAAADWDMQLVRTEIDWTAGLRWQDDVVVSVSTARLGQTSFTLDFQVRRNGGAVSCSARTVYVVIGKDGSGKRPLPPELAAALGPTAPPREARA